jgi:hypothetical protein
VAAPEKKKVKKPAGLKMRTAWFRRDLLGVNPVVYRGVVGCQAWRAARCGVRCHAGLKMADGDHLIPVL